MTGARGLAAGALLLLLASLPSAALAVTEEFSTFDVAAQEQDDESLLDHFMTRPPIEWRAEWEGSPQAIRTSQGCLTSGQWFIDTDLKLRSALGRRASLDVDLKQSESDAAAYDHLDFTFRFPRRWGTPGVMFRPLHDKSRQDFGVSWGWGADTSATQIDVAFVFEDLFNNLWAFRQTQVGEDSEPYTRHPYEPALRVATRHSSWRAEIGGRSLTPSVKRLRSMLQPERVSTLWGSLGWATLEGKALGFEGELLAQDEQARSTAEVIESPDGRHDVFRRRWSAEAALRRSAGRVWAEARFLYQSRDQDWGPPVGPARFGAIDRLIALETRVAMTPRLTARVGGLFDRITVDRVGNTPFSYGTRNESRAFVGVIARFGRVSLSGVEGIELDPEPYDVWGVHDKGFLQMQATF